MGFKKYVRHERSFSIFAERHFRRARDCSHEWSRMFATNALQAPLAQAFLKPEALRAGAPLPPCRAGSSRVVGGRGRMGTMDWTTAAVAATTAAVAASGRMAAADETAAAVAAQTTAAVAAQRRPRGSSEVVSGGSVMAAADGAAAAVAAQTTAAVAALSLASLWASRRAAAVLGQRLGQRRQGLGQHLRHPQLRGASRRLGRS